MTSLLRAPGWVGSALGRAGVEFDASICEVTTSYLRDKLDFNFKVDKDTPSKDMHFNRKSLLEDNVFRRS